MLKELVMFTTMFIVYVLSKTPRNFGPFNLRVTECTVCKGPKRKDCSVTTATVRGEAKVKFDMIVKENTSPSKGKIIAMSNGKEHVKIHVKKPCEHVFLRPTLNSILNITKDCVVLKGYYHFNVDIDTVSQKFYGGMFLYGNWTFKWLLYSEDCNFSCILLQAVVTERY